MDFDSKKIYLTFVTDWHNFRNEYSAKFSKPVSVGIWKDFIKSKDLGIICLEATSTSSGDLYKIIDKKKWLLAKLKYGF